jgi:crossover junction endodeoxyribonuclease RuvC
MRIAAVDPGLSGAIAALERIGDDVSVVSVIDIPIVGEGSKRRLDAPNFVSWLAAHAPQHVYVEHARPMPQQGATSMFRYGRICGAIEGVIAARTIPFTLIDPRAWKRALHLDGNKENARARALQLFPSAASELQRAKDHNRAEAVLLGIYALSKGLSA